jgi:hypothetical protein
MKKPTDAAQAILDATTARAAAHKARTVPVKAEPIVCRFCGHPYLEPCADDGTARGEIRRVVVREHERVTFHTGGPT